MIFGGKREGFIYIDLKPEPIDLQPIKTKKRPDNKDLPEPDFDRNSF